MEELRDLGVLYWKLDADNHEHDPKLQAIREARGYSYQVTQRLAAAQPVLEPAIPSHSRLTICTGRYHCLT